MLKYYFRGIKSQQMRTLIILFFLINTFAMAQENTSLELPFKSIPEDATSYVASNILVRMIEGAGYRFYWATEGLTSDDLKYKPSESGQSIWVTLEHIYGLSDIIRNTSMNTVSIRPPADTPTDWATLRMKTLLYLEDATKHLKNKSPEELAALEIVFERGGKQSTFPLWNMINGPISDIMYHTGQIVSFRRTNGNPLPKGVNVFTGRTKE